MSALCRLFGHKLPTSYYRNDVPYLSVHFYAVDGMGVHHVDLRGECPRCRKTVLYAHAHLPEPKDSRWFDHRSAKAPNS